MKKLIAMTLALVLSLSMAAVAFATDYDDPTDYASASSLKPGDTITFEADDFEDYVPSGGGTTVEVDPDYMDSEYFSIKVDYERGKDLVKDVKFDDGYIVLTFKDNVIEAPSISNFKIKNVTLTGKKNGIGADKAYRNKRFELDSSVLSDFQTAKKVGYVPLTTAINDYVADTSDNEDNIIKFDDSNGSYGTIIIDFADLATAEVRVYKNEKFYFGTNSKADIDIVKANPDAELEFVNFLGRPSFSSNANVEIFAGDDYKYIYEIKNGKLVATSFKYDEDAAAFTGKARTLGYYVMSDKRLKTSTVADSSDSDTGTTPDADNPDTGANTMVGVAAALAVVSLVAAGAVSFKKK